MWGMIIVQMKKLGFTLGMPHGTPAEMKAINELLWTLPAIAGLAGATLRIPNSFLIAIGGGRNVIFLTTSFLLIPAVGAGIALRNVETPFLVFAVLAATSGFGGGNFASSMSNISFFFPKKVQGMSLGLNAGLGNFGVTTMQILVPLVMTMGIFGGDPMTLVNSSGTLIGKIPAGTDTYIHNAGYVWLLLLVPLAFFGWFGNLVERKRTTGPGFGDLPGFFPSLCVGAVPVSIFDSAGYHYQKLSFINGDA